MTAVRKTGYQARQHELQKKKYRMDGLSDHWEIGECQYHFLAPGDMEYEKTTGKLHSKNQVWGEADVLWKECGHKEVC